MVKRTPSISTTDLVGRMLGGKTDHFIKSLQSVLDGEEGDGDATAWKAEGKAKSERIRQYATDESGKAPGAEVWFWTASNAAKLHANEEEKGSFHAHLHGSGPKLGQRVVYVDGGFDLFSSGHIEFLRLVVEAEEKLAQKDGWYDEQAVNERKGKGGDYGPVYVVAGVHDDEVIHHWKGVNYPIMNIYERGLCVLQCRVGPIFLDAIRCGFILMPRST